MSHLLLLAIRNISEYLPAFESLPVPQNYSGCYPASCRLHYLWQRMDSFAQRIFHLLQRAPTDQKLCMRHYTRKCHTFLHAFRVSFCCPRSVGIVDVILRVQVPSEWLHCNALWFIEILCVELLIAQTNHHRYKETGSINVETAYGSCM